MNRKTFLVLGCFLLILVLAGCSSAEPEPTWTPSPTWTPVPTWTPEPVQTPYPSPTKKPVTNLEANQYYNDGLIQLNAGEYDNAIANFTLAITLNPRDGQAYVTRGSAKNKKELYEEAIRDFEQGILLGSRNLEALHGLSLANMSIGEYLDALIYHDELILLQPDNPSMLAARGAIKYALGKHQYASALIDLDRAIKLDPQLASAYYIRGAIYQAQGQNVKAKYDRDKSKELEAAQK